MKTFTQPMQGLKEFEDLEAALPKPVSYTHLDVYKRQHWLQRLDCHCVA